MESITVRFIDEDGDPVDGKKVTIFRTHSVMPQTWLKDFTGDDGRVEFEFDYCLAVDVHVNTECQLEGVDDDGGEVTASI